MEYLAFALKYRPKNFNEVIGQTHLVSALKSAIIKERVHHAYLFSGPRGVGKTSLARILAKSLNCSEGPTPNSCGSCPSCQEISRGTSLDIIEIDGASNRGIDEIRTLRENVLLSPAYARYKIYIIDEVHMLTQEAFNALLKTLEEPPSHVKFIFATTHPHKVLPTILSRCQKFQFSLLSLEEIVKKLKMIVNTEKLNIDDNLLYAVARAAEGSIRDAESLLDQLAPVILEKGSVEDILSFLGIIGEDILNEALKYIVEKDLSGILEFINKINQQGKDLGIFLSALIEHLRNLLLLKVSVRAFRELIDISSSAKDFILKLSDKITITEALKAIDLLIEAKELSQKLNTVRIPFELALIKFSYKERVSPQDINVLPQSNRKEEPVAQKTQIKDNSLSPADENKYDFDFKMEEVDFSRDEDKESAPIAEVSKVTEVELPDDDLLITEVKAKWPQILSGIQKVRAAIASHLFHAAPLSSSGNAIRIAFPKKDYFHKEIVEDTKNLNFIEEIISKFMNRQIKIKFVTTDEPPISPSEELENKKTEDLNNKNELDRQTQNNEFINDLLDTFGGKVDSGAQ